MNDMSIAHQIKRLRTKKGFSQEQLSEESSISIRTIQRIESGESVPRGHTLQKLTQALGILPADLIETDQNENKGYLTLLNISALTTLFHPLLGIALPLAMWVLKKDGFKRVEANGKKILNFQITWALVIYTFLFVASHGTLLPLHFNFISSLPIMFNEFTLYTIVLLLIYFYHLSVTVRNINRSTKSLKNRYIPAIPFFKLKK
ncbi:MAG: DNA-binding protein [Pseudozobellia sp.]|nr:DNA-binding protein [Pseudozobellia sp.]MBG47879.1 DNA-binding protein [Pseudozobellia sp.]|tara:strand:+ start:5491 stop:6102 length:612 start_codon:yes stop_codon:yes gene_type:complete